MKIKATVTFEYRLNDSEIAEFKSRVLEYIQENEDDWSITLDDISNESIEEFLSESLPDIIEELYRGYDHNSGIIMDDYFGTISLDYYGEDVRGLVEEMADQIIADREE